MPRDLEAKARYQSEWKKRRVRDAPTKLCECGCGEHMPSIKWNGEPRKFIHGHGPTRKATPGETYTGPDGYVREFAPDEAGTKSGWAFQHRLVWIRAHGPIGRETAIHHKNHDKADNRLENLDAMTNSDHLRLHWAERSRGGVVCTDPAHLDKGTNSKLTPADVVTIRSRLVAGERQEDVAQDFGVTNATVSRIWVRETWRCQEGCETAPRQHKRTPKPKKPRMPKVRRASKPRIPKVRAKRVQFNFRVEPELAEAIDAAAKAQGITKSEFARRALRAGVAATFAEFAIDAPVGGASGQGPENLERPVDPSPDATAPSDEEEIELIMATGKSRAYATALVKQRRERKK